MLHGIDNKVLNRLLQSSTVLRNVEDQLRHSDAVIYSTDRFIKQQVIKSINAFENALITPDTESTRCNEEDS